MVVEGEISRRRPLEVLTAMTPTEEHPQQQTLPHALENPIEVSPSRLWGIMVGVLFIVASIVDAMVLAAMNRSVDRVDPNETCGIPDIYFPRRDVIWFIFGCILHLIFFLDLSISYLAGGRMGLVILLEKVLHVEYTRGKVLLVLSLLLPGNVLFLYMELGAPAWETSGLISDSEVAGLMANWSTGTTLRTGGGLAVDSRTWEVFRLIGTNGTTSVVHFDHSGVWSHCCYGPASPEFRILKRLRSETVGDEHRPKQGYCKSAFGFAMDGYLGIDDDHWEELILLLLLLFAALVGFVARKAVEAESGGFLEDVFDIIEMYTFTFVDKQQAIEGRVTLAEQGETALGASMHFCIWTFIWIGYLTILFRAMMLMGWSDPIHDPIHKLKLLLRNRFEYEIEETELTMKISSISSLLSIELPFLTLRILCAAFYSIPVSIVALKNVFCACHDINQIFFSIDEPGADLFTLSDPMGEELAIEADVAAWVGQDAGSGAGDMMSAQQSLASSHSRSPITPYPQSLAMTPAPITPGILSSPSGRLLRVTPTGRKVRCRYGIYCKDDRPSHTARFYHGITCQVHLPDLDSKPNRPSATTVGMTDLPDQEFPPLEALLEAPWERDMSQGSTRVSL